MIDHAPKTNNKSVKGIGKAFSFRIKADISKVIRSTSKLKIWKKVIKDEFIKNVKNLFTLDKEKLKQYNRDY